MRWWLPFTEWNGMRIGKVKRAFCFRLEIIGVKIATSHTIIVQNFSVAQTKSIHQNQKTNATKQRLDSCIELQLPLS